eukprot:822703-Rhodomonas_salina.3
MGDGSPESKQAAEAALKVRSDQNTSLPVHFVRDKCVIVFDSTDARYQRQEPSFPVQFAP